MFGICSRNVSKLLEVISMLSILAKSQAVRSSDLRIIIISSKYEGKSDA